MRLTSLAGILGKKPGKGIFLESSPTARICSRHANTSLFIVVPTPGMRHGFEFVLYPAVGGTKQVPMWFGDFRPVENAPASGSTLAE